MATAMTDHQAFLEKFIKLRIRAFPARVTKATKIVRS